MLRGTQAVFVWLVHGLDLRWWGDGVPFGDDSGEVAEQELAFLWGVVGEEEGSVTAEFPVITEPSFDPFRELGTFTLVLGPNSGLIGSNTLGSGSLMAR